MLANCQLPFKSISVLDIIYRISYFGCLQQITVPLVDSVKCENQYRNSRLGKSYRLHHTLMCAGGEANVDTCIGDGGAPLVCPIEVRLAHVI